MELILLNPYFMWNVWVMESSDVLAQCKHCTSYWALHRQLLVRSHMISYVVMRRCQTFFALFSQFSLRLVLGFTLLYMIGMGKESIRKGKLTFLCSSPDHLGNLFCIFHLPPQPLQPFFALIFLWHIQI